MTVVRIDCACGAVNLIHPPRSWAHCVGCGLIVRKPHPATTTQEELNNER